MYSVATLIYDTSIPLKWVWPPRSLPWNAPNWASPGIAFCCAPPSRALVTRPLTERLGLGRVLIGSIFLACIAKMGIAFANGPFLLALGLVVGGELLFQGIATVYIITSTSLRQAGVPQELRGRAAAVVRVVSWGVGSFGALLGGILAQWSDLRTTMVAAALGTVSALVCIVLSPVRRVQLFE